MLSHSPTKSVKPKTPLALPSRVFYYGSNTNLPNMEHDGAYRPTPPEWTVPISSLKNGHTPPLLSPESPITITLSQEDVSLLRRVLNTVDTLHAQQIAPLDQASYADPISPAPQLEPPQQAVSPPDSPPLELVPLPSPEPPPATSPERPPTAPQRHRGHKSQEDSTHPPAEAPPRASTPNTLVFLQGTRQDIKAAEPIRERLWTGTVRWLAVQSTLGKTHEDIALLRWRMMNLVNLHPDAKWWIEHQDS